MEREILELRKQLAKQQNPPSQSDSATISTPAVTQANTLYQANEALSNQYMAPDDVVASLLDLRSSAGFSGSSTYLSSPRTQRPAPRIIEDVEVAQDKVLELFHLYEPP